MPLEDVPGSDLHYYLVAYDKDGRERSEEVDGAQCFMSDIVIDRLKCAPITDVFIMSHGWKGDLPAARDQYRRWINAIDAVKPAPLCEGFSPLIVGIHWPSLPWGDEDLGIAAALSFDVTAERDAADWLDREVAEYAGRLADTARTRDALRTIFTAATNDIAPQHLSLEVRTAYDVLNAEAGLGSDGPGAGPGADREPFDPDRAYRLARAEPVSFGESGFAGILQPLRQLTFWKMKDRGRKVGECGPHQLLISIQSAAPNVRVHLMGHSFGCIVVSAMLAGAGGRGRLPRAADSLMLVQGALSLWSYCADIPVAPGKSGYFHPVVSGQRVRGAIVTTQSVHDTAVGTFYPMAAGVAAQVVYAPGDVPRYGAVGAFGVRGVEDRTVDLAMLPTNGGYAFQPGWIHNLESSHFICQRQGLSGAHSDIAKPEVVHALWEAARSSIG